MQLTRDVIVIGGGSAGLTAAGGCARLGLRTALIERGRMGGECLNTGCVPSKSLLAAARHAQAVRDGGRFGIRTAGFETDWAAVRAHVDGAIAAIAPHDLEARFREWGVEVIRGEARFVAKQAVAVGSRVLAATIVIATGSRPRIPPVGGLQTIPFLTNETLFGIHELPRRLLVLGGGAAGVEMAQAFRRLGAAVTLLESDRLLAHDDADAVALLTARLEAEGVTVLAGVTVGRAEPMARACGSPSPMAGRSRAVICWSRSAGNRLWTRWIWRPPGWRPGRTASWWTRAGVRRTRACSRSGIAGPGRA